MGLDMSLKKIQRIEYENIDKEKFTYKHYNKSEELIYWRKKYNIHNWFFENTYIYEECSNEIAQEKIEELIKWLFEEGFKEDANKIKEFINEIDFVNNVVFYNYSN